MESNNYECRAVTCDNSCSGQGDIRHLVAADKEGYGVYIQVNPDATALQIGSVVVTD